MLPGVGFSEILVIGVIALLVVGPKDLPLMLRKLGLQMAKLRAMANEFRSGFDELARQAELDELKREVDALRRGAVLTDPVFTDIEQKMTGAIAPPTSNAAAIGDPAPPEEPPPSMEEPPSAPMADPPISPPATDLPDPVHAEPAQATR